MGMQYPPLDYADDDGDPAVMVVFAPENKIHAAFGLPEKPPYIPTGLNAAESKANLVTWLNSVIKQYVDGADVFDFNVEGIKIDGGYSGLRSGEWVGREEIEDWKFSMRNHVPPLSCGRLHVTHGGHGRGHNVTSNPRLGPFRT